MTKINHGYFNEISKVFFSNRHAIKIKKDTISIVKENISKLQNEAKVQETKEQEVYNKYLNKCKETKKLFEDHNPLCNHLKKLQNESLKLEVKNKMLSVKVAEMKKQMKLRREIQKRIFYTTIVNFAKDVSDHWKSHDLSYSINKEMQKREELLKELYELKVAAGKVLKIYYVTNNENDMFQLKKKMN